jgi:hypothetical protein
VATGFALGNALPGKIVVAAALLNPVQRVWEIKIVF